MRIHLLLSIAAALSFTTSVHAQSIVKMVKQDTSFALDSTSSTNPGRQAHLWGAADHPNQEWVELNRGDYFSYQKANTSLCLDGGNGAANRQPVLMQFCDASNLNQQWDKIGLSNGSFRLEKRNTNHSIDGNHGAEQGQQIYLWNSSDSNVNQQWQFSDVGSVPPTTPPPPTDAATFSHRVTFEGESVDISFTRFSSRGPLFSVFEQADNGGLIELDNVPDVQTYIGTIDDQPEAFASALVRSNGEILATVIFPTTKSWVDINGTVTQSEGDNTPLLPTATLNQKAGSDVFAADIYLDVDTTAISASGGNTLSALEMVEYSMTTINAVFMRDAAIINRIGMVLFRTSLSQDPYAPDDAPPLTVFREAMTTLMGLATHDLSALVSTHVPGGVATVGTIGGNQAVSANSPRVNGDFFNVARHEIGHNWGVPHFPGGQHTEGPTIMSGNRFGKFASAGVQLILNERESTADAHLDNLGNFAPSLPPRAGDDLVTVDGNSLTVIEPLSNDNDVNGESISISSVPNQTNAGNSLTLNGDSVTLDVNTTPDDGYDWFRYTIQDESGQTSDAVVHINIE